MKNLKSSKILVALMATTVFMILPTVVMAITDTQATSGGGATPPVANGSNGMNAATGRSQHANPANTNQPTGNINSDAQLKNDRSQTSSTSSVGTNR